MRLPPRAPMSCCPAGSLPYLAANHEAKGKVVSLDAVELYQAPVAGTPTSGILICPDVWGWNGGHVLAIAPGSGTKVELACVCPALMAKLPS